jgi:hypothetical protein
LIALNREFVCERIWWYLLSSPKEDAADTVLDNEGFDRGIEDTDEALRSVGGRGGVAGAGASSGCLPLKKVALLGEKKVPDEGFGSVRDLTRRLTLSVPDPELELPDTKDGSDTSGKEGSCRDESENEKSFFWCFFCDTERASFRPDAVDEYRGTLGAGACDFCVFSFSGIGFNTPLGVISSDKDDDVDARRE